MSIEARSLRKTYGDFSVQVDLKIEEGETLVLAGPSGCGKTTALHLLAGLVAPDGGSILLDGRDLADVPAWKRGIAVVFQDLSLFPHLSVGGNVAFGPFIRGTGRAERERVVEACLRAAHLEGYAKRRLSTLSGGELQRTAIARALAAAPRALLMDEPFSSLDAPLRRALRAEFRELRSQSPYPCLFVTHDREEPATLGDRIAIMKDGRIAEIGGARELFLAPRTAFAARFLGAGAVLGARPIGMDGRRMTVRCGLGTLSVETAGGRGPENGPDREMNLLIPRDALRIVAADSSEAKCRARIRSSVFSGDHEIIAAELADGTVLNVESSPREATSEIGRGIGLAVNERLLRFLEDD